MVLNIICDANLMNWITPEIWWGTAIIVGIIGLCILGYFYKPSDGPLIVLEVLLLAICAAFWPIIIIIALVIGVIALPILLGMHIKKIKSAHDQVKKERFKQMSDAEKIMEK